ncbi:hypothetical protein A5677_07540 [Mycobacterium malmoense]|uniref:Uncharacterized protein n=1 Tax=Mycobacterium malmoense TaxID=1780 RepID=A0A1B9CJT3_MYCMA|nr:hypothetical protein A5677_07540 [Mycobacterium malmoense]
MQRVRAQIVLCRVNDFHVCPIDQIEIEKSVTLGLLYRHAPTQVDASMISRSEFRVGDHHYILCIVQKRLIIGMRERRCH